MDLEKKEIVEYYCLNCFAGSQRKDVRCWRCGSKKIGKKVITVELTGQGGLA